MFFDSDNESTSSYDSNILNTVHWFDDSSEKDHSLLGEKEIRKDQVVQDQYSSSSSSSSATPTTTTTSTIEVYEHASVTMNELKNEGNPSRPLDFPGPVVGRAVRITSNVLDPVTMESISSMKILFRLPNKSKHNDHLRAYCMVKKLNDTTYGSIQLCRVLHRKRFTRKNSRRRLIENNEGMNSSSCCDDSNTIDSSKAYWVATDELVVLKINQWSKVLRLRSRHLEDPVKEIAAKQLLGSHPNFVGYLEVLEDDRNLYCIMPYCEGGCLYTQLTTEFKQNGVKNCLTESRARYWFRQLILGIRQLQMKGVCHRDISLENILVHEGTLKINDLGLCLRVPYSDLVNLGCVTDVSEGSNRRLILPQGIGGNWRYNAPEVVTNNSSFDGFAIDLWASGIILYVMLLGVYPFQIANRSDALFRRISVEKKLGQLFTENKIYISEQATDLLQNMLMEDPEKRLTLYEIMSHKWVTNFQETRKIPHHNDKNRKSIWSKALKLVKTNT